jgi:hypothetical protein
MAAATITPELSLSTVTVNILIGLPPELRTRLEIWQTPGIDGYGAQQLGLGDSDFAMTTVAYCASNDDANTMLKNIAYMQGEVVDIVDNWGDSYLACLVKRVNTTAPGTKRPVIYQGNASAVRVEVQWEMVVAF